MGQLPASDISIHSQRRKIVIWFAAFILVAVGVYLSWINFLGQEWLSRSGCAIVILGIWSGLGSIIQERILLGRLRRRRRNAIIQARAELELELQDSAEIDKEIEKIEEIFTQQAAELAHKLKLSLGIMEFSILVTGTFLWGFGDLLVEFLVSN